MNEPSAPLRSRVPWVAAALTFGVHLVANPHYGYFRDELYFIICGRHPALGYVDQPPLVPLLAAASQAFGHSLVALRAVAALCAAASVYVTCVLAAELGGGAFAQAFAALTAAFCPVLCSFGMKLSTDTIGLWTWPLIGLEVLRLSRGADRRRWLGVGALLGVTLEAKYSVIYFAVALLVGLVCTRERRILRNAWFAAGVGIAVMLALPNFAWQARHGFPMLELLRNGQAGKNVILSPAAYLEAELLITNPILALAWLAGLAWLAMRPTTRFLALAFGVLIAAMIASHAKHYYPADAYPVLFAAGGVAVERFTRARVWLRPVLTTIAAGAGIVLVPYVLPVLPIDAFLRYHRAMAPVLHAEATRTEHAPATALPQDWADMRGWPELADAVGRTVASLPAAERARVAIVASNYGEAAAIDFFGERYHLPPVLSRHNQYFLWGTRGFDGDVLVDVHGDCGAEAHLFRSSVEAAVVATPLAMPWENPTRILICRGIARPLSQIWPSIKMYY
ncbi:MAG TPA: glycosyltransferase family 39 protein [Polyangia bacterium]|jgi:4-amino-4-deoxy-L-arabinose transferase-like glycosyltransferase